MLKEKNEGTATENGNNDNNIHTHTNKTCFEEAINFQPTSILYNRPVLTFFGSLRSMER